MTLLKRSFALVVALVAMIVLAPAHAVDGTAPSQKDPNAAAALNAQGDAAYRAGSFDNTLAFRRLHASIYDRSIHALGNR
ncbi:hypothetical protein [Roseateles depolymerans]|uniref:Uncharacterized protein n=1 Tax=Roseateles depolymerans TaxID=76731 RepID=A0A0U3CKR3_9BURK|nr:hypothetical protein [Roseateles depolymerans]ALV09192.1 hypothetical protein RD2015_4754 [Roseateles depolymerans]REG13949.1 hypothetical protein DES44_3960 [Roseateles depolymerans]